MIPANLIPKTFQVAVILLAVAAVAVADVFLKKAATQGSLGAILGSSWLWAATGLYLIQIGLFTLAFASGWKLSLIGALQTALYALIVLGAGVLLFQESLTRTQVIGAALAFSGVILINWPS